MHSSWLCIYVCVCRRPRASSSPTATVRNHLGWVTYCLNVVLKKHLWILWAARWGRGVGVCGACGIVGLVLVVVGAWGWGGVSGGVEVWEVWEV